MYMQDMTCYIKTPVNIWRNSLKHDKWTIKMYWVKSKRVFLIIHFVKKKECLFLKKIY